jgi:nucleotidyltransferase/DNA polymerase involved in DNA repair
MQYEEINNGGKVLLWDCQRYDNRPVEPNQEAKSIGAEDTFPEDLMAINDMKKELDKIATTVNKVN